MAKKKKKSKGKDPRKGIVVTNIDAALKVDRSELKREKMFRKQRWEWGFDDRETWSLDYRIAIFVYPRLKRFNEVRAGYPASMSEEEWDTIIKKMLYSFRTIAEDDLWGKDVDWNKMKEGLDLFGKHFLDLWW
jgi:hypothetical protein